MGLTDGPLTQWIRIGLNGCTEGPESFQCPAEEQSWVAFLQMNIGTTTGWLKEDFTWKYWCVVSQDTPQSSACPCGEGYCAEFVLVTPLPRTVLVSWWLPGPLGWDGLPVWSVHPCLQDLHAHSEPSSVISGSCWTEGAAWFRSVFRTSTWGRLLWKLPFLVFGLIPAFLIKSQWQRATCGIWRLHVFADMIILPYSIFFFFLYDERAFTLGLNLTLTLTLT